MRPEDRLAAMEELLADLAEASERLPVVVEGESDEIALRALGVDGQIERLNRGEPVLAVCEALARGHREVIVLTDWDRKGGQLARLLREGLAANAVRPNLEYRKALARLAHVRTVEGLAGWLATLRDRVARRDGGTGR